MFYKFIQVLKKECLIKHVLENDAMAEITKPVRAATENKILTEFYTSITYQYNFKYHMIALTCGKFLNDTDELIYKTETNS